MEIDNELLHFIIKLIAKEERKLPWALVIQEVRKEKLSCDEQKIIYHYNLAYSKLGRG